MVNSHAVCRFVGESIGLEFELIAVGLLNHFNVLS